VHALFLVAVLVLTGTLPTGDWSLAGSILTFAFPVGLFIVVATVLYYQFTRPHTVPGHRELMPAAAMAGGGTGRHVAGAPRHAAPPAAGSQPPAGGAPPAGGQHAAEGTVDWE
jgi:hypothetical protein